MVNNGHEDFDKCDLSTGNVIVVEIAVGQRLKSWGLSKIQSFKTFSTQLVEA